LGLSADEILISLSSVRRGGYKSGTRLCTKPHRAFRFYPAAFELKEYGSASNTQFCTFIKMIKMGYNKKELLSLPADERLELAEELWSSVEENLMPVTDEEIAFAEERLKLHEANPDEGMSLTQLKKYFADKYGF